MAADTPATTALRRMIAAFNTGDISVIDEFVADAYIDHQGLRGVEIRGLDGFSRVVAAARSGYESVRVVVEDLFGEGDRAVARLRWLGERPDGSLVERETIEVVRVADGKAVEHWGARYG
jgi:predicted SnoaL-like aldol condensation-catalyzing enzyme